MLKNEANINKAKQKLKEGKERIMMMSVEFTAISQPLRFHHSKIKQISCNT